MNAKEARKLAEKKQPIVQKKLEKFYFKSIINNIKSRADEGHFSYTCFYILISRFPAIYNILIERGYKIDDDEYRSTISW